ncbi:MAG: sigma-70 family RNA polymerase sigma factor [Thermomicrobiales bacterium]
MVVALFRRRTSPGRPPEGAVAAGVPFTQHDRHAFAALYQDYFEPVYRYCYARLGNQQRAEDAAHQVFVRALEAFDRYQETGRAREWLFVIAHNVVANEMTKRTAAPLDMADDVPDPEASPESLAFAAVDREALREAITRLPQDQRRAIELRIAGLTGREIAAASGEELWQSPLSAAANRGAAFADGAVFLGTSDGAFHAIDAASGEQRWRIQTDNVGGVMATPVVAGGLIYEITFNGPVPNRLYAFDAATGDERWRMEVPQEFVSIAGAAGGTVYAGSAAGVLFALDAATGTERWRFAADDIVDTGPGIVGDTVYIVSQDRHVYALDAANGAERWRFPIDGSSSWGPVASGGVLYLGDVFGNVYAIAGSEGDLGGQTLPAPAGPADASPAAGTPVASQPQEPEQLWQTAGGSDALSAVAGAAVDAQGNLYVTDAGNDRIQIFSPEGDVLETWDGTEGGGEPFVFEQSNGDFESDIAFSPNGTIHVIDAGNQSIRQYAPDRTFLRAWGGFGNGDGQFVTPFGIAVDADGNVYVSDDTRNDVQKFDMEGNFLAAFGGPESGDGDLHDLGSLGVDGEGNVLVADWGNNRIVKFASDGTFLQEWGSTGSGPGEFRSPSDVTVDEAGNVYVSDLENGRIQVFAADGGYLTEWDAGTAPSGSQNLPYALALDGNGTLYAMSIASGSEEESTVQKFRLPEATAAALPAGTGPALAAIEFAGDITGGDDPLGAPAGMAVAADGTLYVVESSNDRVRVFDGAGAPMATWGESGTEAGQFQFHEGDAAFGDVKIGPDGSVYVLEMIGNRVQKFSADGEVVDTWGGFGTGDGQFTKPTTLTIDAESRIHVVDQDAGRVQVFDADGTFLHAWGSVGSNPGQFDKPWELVVRPDGTFLVSDTGGRILAFGADGNFTGLFADGEENTHPDSSFGLDIDAAGNIYAYDYLSNQVFVFGPDGALLASWGEAGAAPGRFQGPNDIALDGAGLLYVADDGNGRIQVFRLLPPLT